MLVVSRRREGRKSYKAPRERTSYRALIVKRGSCRCWGTQASRGPIIVKDETCEFTLPPAGNSRKSSPHRSGQRSGTSFRCQSLAASEYYHDELVETIVEAMVLEFMY